MQETRTIDGGIVHLLRAGQVTRHYALPAEKLAEIRRYNRSAQVNEILAEIERGPSWEVIAEAQG